MRMGSQGNQSDPQRGLGRHVLGLRFLVCLVACLACASPGDKRIAAGETPGRIAAVQRAGAPGRVLLISVSGLESADFLTNGGFVPGPGESVRMPELARLAGEGVVGEAVRTPSPGSTYASHASIATGRMPDGHGVISDFRLDGEGTGVTPFWDRRMLAGEALWDAAIGRGVLALGWPTTIGARIELLLPEATPSDRKQPWLDLMRSIASPALVRDLEAISTDALSEGGRNAASWPTPAERDAAMGELACNVALSDRDPGLWMIRFSQTEEVHRGAGRGSRALADALGRIDAEIGGLVRCLDEAGQLAETAIFVVGDVAYRSAHTRVDPNVILVSKGLIGRDPRASTGVRSWLAIVRSQGRSAYVYAKDAKSAVEARNILEVEARRSKAFRIVPATEMASGGVDPQAWFGLAAEPGFVIGNGLGKPFLRPSIVRSSPGALRLASAAPEPVGFVAWGRGIRSRVRIPEMELVDVAPTIAALLGVRLEGAIDGIPIFGILRARIPAPPPGPKRIGVDNDGDANRALRDLGGGR